MNRCWIFLYGTLKPGQLAHGLIRDDIEAGPFDAELREHELYTRDGLPFVRSKSGSPVMGSLVDGGCELLDRVEAYEGTKNSGNTDDSNGRSTEPGHDRLYKLEQTKVLNLETGELVQAFVFVERGRSRRRDGRRIDSGNWTAANDPVFALGYPALSESIALALKTITPTFPDHGAYWERFWQLQGYYLNLASVLERFALYLYGPSRSRWSAMKELDIDYGEIVKDLNLPRVAVHASNSADNATLSTEEAPFRTWYQVRSNIVHQGKSTEDFERIFDAVVGLDKSLGILLGKCIDGLDEQWRRGQTRSSQLSL